MRNGVDRDSWSRSAVGCAGFRLVAQALGFKLLRSGGTFGSPARAQQSAGQSIKRWTVISDLRTRRFAKLSFSAYISRRFNLTHRAGGRAMVRLSMTNKPLFIDPVDGVILAPSQVFLSVACEEGLLPNGSTAMTKELWSYTMAVVDLCALVGDAYGDPQTGVDAGEHIRAKYLEKYP